MRRNAPSCTWVMAFDDKVLDERKGEREREREREREKERKKKKRWAGLRNNDFCESVINPRKNMLFFFCSQQRDHLQPHELLCSEFSQVILESQSDENKQYFKMLSVSWWCLCCVCVCVCVCVGTCMCVGSVWVLFVLFFGGGGRDLTHNLAQYPRFAKAPGSIREMLLLFNCLDKGEWSSVKKKKKQREKGLLCVLFFFFFFFFLKKKKKNNCNLLCTWVLIRRLRNLQNISGHPGKDSRSKWRDLVVRQIAAWNTRMSGRCVAEMVLTVCLCLHVCFAIMINSTHSFLSLVHNIKALGPVAPGKETREDADRSLEGKNKTKNQKTNKTKQKNK